MRELVYLSERKLRQFQAPKKRRFSIREIGIPGIGQVGIDQQADSHLDAVIAHLEDKARWYEEDVQVGQWVHFEARLGHHVVGGEDRPRVLLLAEPAGGTGSRRLVLHGSPEHLLGEHATLTTDWDDAALRGSFASFLRPLIWHLMRTEDKNPAEDDSKGGALLRRGLWLLNRLLDDALDPDTAAWMAGYARITMNTADLPVVLASPLYVEYVSPPDQ